MRPGSMFGGALLCDGWPIPLSMPACKVISGVVHAVRRANMHLSPPRAAPLTKFCHSVLSSLRDASLRFFQRYPAQPRTWIPDSLATVIAERKKRGGSAFVTSIRGVTQRADEEERSFV